MGRWGKRSKKKGKVWCSKHQGYGPGPLRIWNKHKVCAICYKTLTKFKLIPDFNTGTRYTHSINAQKWPWGWTVVIALIVIIGAAALF